MSYLINGTELHTYPPVESISVNKNTVVFKDAKSKHKVRLNDAGETRQFLNWLLDISSTH